MAANLSGKPLTTIITATCLALLGLIVWLSYQGTFLTYAHSVLRSTQIFRAEEAQVFSPQQQQQQLQQQQEQNASKPAEYVSAEYVSPVAGILFEFLTKHNCNDVYLDLGSNLGVQVRKLYQPSCFPKAPAICL
jgi:hypothetical protein